MMPEYKFFYKGRGQDFLLVVTEQELNFLPNEVAYWLRQMPKFPRQKIREEIITFASQVPDRLRNGEVEIEYNISDWGDKTLLRVVRLQ